MANDAAILVAGFGSAPLDYTVPNAQEIEVLLARAVVDGSGAGAAFLPVLQLVSDAGLILAEAITDTTVAAGGSAQVSWFPRVGAAAAAAATAFAWADGAGTQNVNSAALTNLTTEEYTADPTGAITWPTYSGALHGASLNSVGMYLVGWSVAGDSASLTGANISFDGWADTLAGLYTGGLNVSYDPNPANILQRIFAGFGIAWIHDAYVGRPFHLLASTSALSEVRNRMSIVYLGARAA